MIEAYPQPRRRPTRCLGAGRRPELVDPVPRWHRDAPEMQGFFRAAEEVEHAAKTVGFHFGGETLLGMAEELKQGLDVRRERFAYLI